MKLRYSSLLLILLVCCFSTVQADVGVSTGQSVCGAASADGKVGCCPAVRPYKERFPGGGGKWKACGTTCGKLCYKKVGDTRDCGAGCTKACCTKSLKECCKTGGIWKACGSSCPKRCYKLVGCRSGCSFK